MKTEKNLFVRNVTLEKEIEPYNRSSNRKPVGKFGAVQHI